MICSCKPPSLSRSFSNKAVKNYFSAPTFAQFLAAVNTTNGIPQLHGLPEVIVTGRANVGKSTLLNAVVNRKNLLKTSKKPGRTRTLNFYQVGLPPGGLVLVDAPGYGGRGRPEWGELFDHYIDTRKELKRIFILFNGNHGLNETDRIMIQTLDQHCQDSAGLKFTLQAIITKADTIPSDKIHTHIPKIKQDIFQAAPTCLPPIITYVEKNSNFGIDQVRKAISDACLA